MRRESRELAMQILFHDEFEPQLSIQDLLSLYEKSFNSETLDYAQKLVEGVKAVKENIDQVINSASNHWKVSRMSSVDRNIIRVATYELKFSTERIEPQVAINEALEIAKKYSTSESISFLNGVLDQVAKK